MTFSLSLTHPFLLIFTKIGPTKLPLQGLCPSLTTKPWATVRGTSFHIWTILILPKNLHPLPLKVSIWVRKWPKTAFKNYFWGDRFTLLCYQTNSWLVWNGSKISWELKFSAHNSYQDLSQNDFKNYLPTPAISIFC